MTAVGNTGNDLICATSILSGGLSEAQEIHMQDRARQPEEPARAGPAPWGTHGSPRHPTPPLHSPSHPGPRTNFPLRGGPEELEGPERRWEWGAPAPGAGVRRSVGGGPLNGIDINQLLPSVATRKRADRPCPGEGVHALPTQALASPRLGGNW